MESRVLKSVITEKKFEVKVIWVQTYDNEFQIF